MRMPKCWRGRSSIGSSAPRSRRRPHWPKRLRRQWRRPSAVSPGRRSGARSERVFQALRIAVNDEYGALEAFLRLLPQCMAQGGRVAILTFHSGEDRRVKQAFKDGLRSGAFARIADEIVRPTVRRAARQSTLVGGEAALGGAINHVQRATSNVRRHFCGSANATMPVGPGTAGTASRPPRPPTGTAGADAVTSRYCRPLELVHRRRSARRRRRAAARQICLPVGAVVDVHLAVGRRDEQQAGRRSTIIPPLTVAAVPVPLMPCADEPQIVAEPDLPLDRAAC